jgi:hypothetical protein
MYYSQAEMDYVEGQRMKRILEAAASGKIELVKDDEGVRRYVKDGRYWQPDMSDIKRL